MALIKCPECKNNISDQADVCPKCGYEINNNNKTNKNNKKIDYKYLLIGLLIIVVGFYMLNNRNTPTTGGGSDNPTTNPSTGTTTPGTNNGYVEFNDTNLGLSYEIPSNYKTYVDNNKLSYVGSNIDNEGPLIPYIVLGWDSTYSDPAQFLNAFTKELQKVYGEVLITIDMISNTIGNYYVYGIQYQYNSSGHTVIDNRYAIKINNKILMIGSKEENVNTDTINNIVGVIIQTLKGGN
mgnify:FL=1